jgi:membrane protein CcdC involved in cytochrome C biogenesis
MDWTINATTFGSESFKGGQMSAEFFFLIAAIIILLQLRTRRVRLWTTWVPPAIILLPITVVTIAADYGGPGTLLLALAGFAVGCPIGVVIGSRMKVTADDQGRILLKGSVVAVTIWILVLGLRLFGKSIIGDWGIISLNDLSAMALALTLGSIIARRAYVTIKYLQLKKQNTAGTTDTMVTVEPLNQN